MKRKILWFALMAMVLLATSPALADTFINGGFEDNSFNGWTQGAGRWTTPGTLPNPTDYLPSGSKYNIAYNKSAIVTPGNDPIVGSNLNRVYNGSYAARVNDSVNDYTVSVISQTVNNYSDSHIYFAWAAVLEASHGSNDSDNFTLKLTDDTAGTTLYQVQYNSHDNGAIFHPYSSWFYTDWQVEDLDVSASIGHTFTLTLLGSDCPYGGHAGYVYLDGFGVAPPVPDIPIPSTLLLLGSGMAGLAGWRRFMKS